MIVHRILHAAAAAALGASAALFLGAHEARSQSGSLDDAYRAIAGKQFVDLTHTFAPGIPHWKGFRNETARTQYWYDPRPGTLGSGFYAQMFCHVGQWGTHVDPPAHFAKGGRTVDQIDPKEMVMPLVVLDVHARAAANPDYVLTLADVKAWEARHGPAPARAFVAMRTDWSKRWPSDAAMANKDARGIGHYPGWSMPVLRYLYDERHITASGHETTDTDPGVRASHDDFSLESWILHHDHYQIEMLANLDRVPESGALAIVTFAKPKDGSGFPARVIAILP
ncbi:MAG: cyclase family protein [Candidatus Velthaea sp.]